MECPNTNTLAKLLDDDLSPPSVTAVRAHVDRCEACAALLGELVRGEATHSATRARALAPTELAANDPPAADAVPPELAVPSTLGRYQLVARLGAGGMGVVYAAFDPALARTVALKLLHPRRAGSVDASAELGREARAMARLDSVYVLRIFDVGVADGRDYVAMEYLEGLTLAQWLKVAPRAPAEILALCLNAGRGLAAAHAVGVVHHDFKPDNVLVDREGRPRVADFGLARLWTQGAPTVLGHEVSGTPAYMAPEQWLGAQVGPATDQFAFCVVLYEALFGVRPFGGTTARERLAAMLVGVPATPESYGAFAWALPVLLKGLSPRPEQRYGSMNELLAALEREPERKLARQLAWQRAALWTMTVVHWGLLALLVAAYQRPVSRAVFALTREKPESAGEFLALFVAGALCVALGVWFPTGLLWAPLNAAGLGGRKPWALRSTWAYAWLSLFTLLGTPYALFALWGLSRRNVRAAFG